MKASSWMRRAVSAYTAKAASKRLFDSDRSSGTPSRKLIALFEFAGTRSPGRTIPIKFRGSAAERVTISLAGAAFRAARRDSTATGKANCSPMNPLTNRPPRTSAAVFQSAKCNEQLAPSRHHRFSRDKLAEDDAIAPEQHPARSFDNVRALGRVSWPKSSDQRPRCGAGARFDRGPARRAAWDRSARECCRTRRR